MTSGQSFGLHNIMQLPINQLRLAFPLKLGTGVNCFIFHFFPSHIHKYIRRKLLNLRNSHETPLAEEIFLLFLLKKYFPPFSPFLKSKGKKPFGQFYTNGHIMFFNFVSKLHPMKLKNQFNQQMVRLTLSQILV